MAALHLHCCLPGLLALQAKQLERDTDAAIAALESSTTEPLCADGWVVWLLLRVLLDMHQRYCRKCLLSTPSHGCVHALLLAVVVHLWCSLRLLAGAACWCGNAHDCPFAIAPPTDAASRQSSVQTGPSVGCAGRWAV